MNSVPVSGKEVVPELILEQVEKIVTSRRFVHSKSLDRFLRYVVGEKLAGREQALKEYTIGVEVFHRGEQYDPRTSAVVRVQAKLLRGKLEEYYSDEGASDEIAIDLPKGGYVPQFFFRPAVNGTGAQAPKTSSPRRWRLATAIIAGGSFVAGLVLAALLQVYLRPGPEASRVPAAPAIPTSPLWQSFFRAGSRTILTYGTPQFFSGNAYHFRDIRVNSLAEGQPIQQLAALGKALGVSLRPSEPYTGVGEAQGIYVISRFFSERSRQLQVVRNQLASWDDLKRSNGIFLASMRFQTLATKLGLPTDFIVAPEIGSIRNLNPRPGESAVYQHRTIKGQETDYAVVTVWPGLSENTRLMVLSGYTTWGTQAAAEFVTSEAQLAHLDRALAECSSTRNARTHPPFFQVLLRVHVRDKEPVASTYVTHHDLEIKEPARPAL